MCEQESDWVDVVKDLKCRSRKGIIHPPSPHLRRDGKKSPKRSTSAFLESPKYRQIKFLLARNSPRIDEEKEIILDQTNSVARSSSSSSRVPQIEYFNLRNRSTRTWPVPVRLLPSQVGSRIRAPPLPSSSSLCSRNSEVISTKRVQSHCKRSGTPSRRLITSKSSDCVQCLIRFFEVKDYLGGGGLRSVKSGRSKMSRVSSTSPRIKLKNL